MSPPPLNLRIIGALRLAPMTTRQLSRVLSVDWRTAWGHVCELRSRGLIVPAGRHAGMMGAPSSVWGIA